MAHARLWWLRRRCQATSLKLVAWMTCSKLWTRRWRSIPRPLQSLGDQPINQQDQWPTLRRALNIDELPAGITWESLADEMVDRLGVNRRDEVPDSGDTCILAS